MHPSSTKNMSKTSIQLPRIPANNPGGALRFISILVAMFSGIRDGEVESE